MSRESSGDRVTVVIPTYARTACLEQALWCCLRQEQACSIVVLNDCEKQTLVLDDERVRIVNTGLFPTLGAKRNALLDLVETEWACWLDDDDWVLPWYVGDLLSHAVVDSEHNVLRPDKIWWVVGGHNGDKNITWSESTAVMPGFARVSAVRGLFPAGLDCGEDQMFLSKTNAAKVPVSVGGYAYRWANGTHHISGTMQDLGGVSFRAEAERRFDLGLEPMGTIRLLPYLDPAWWDTSPESVKQRLKDIF